MNSIVISILTTIAFHSSPSLAGDSKYGSLCLEALGTIQQAEVPIILQDPVALGDAKWTLTWDGKSIYRESDIKVFSKQVGTSKQEIWSLKKFKESGDGNTKVAPTLQVENAKSYFLSRALFNVGKTLPPEARAKDVDLALSACEGASENVTLDGEPLSSARKAKRSSASDVALDLRTKIRTTMPQLFKDKAQAEKGAK